MKSRYLFFAVICIVFGVIIESGFAQQTSLDRGGREFWMCAIPHFHVTELNKRRPPLVHNPISNVLDLIIYSEAETNVELTIPRLGWKRTINTKDSSAYVVTLPKDSVSAWYFGIPEDRGLRITSDRSIRVSWHNMMAITSDASLALPFEMLGTEYFITDFHPFRDFDYSYNTPAIITVLATQNGTTVNIETLTGSDWGESHSVTLQMGQTYQLHGQHDPTGTRITSDKPIAVYSGGNNVNTVPLFAGTGGGNNIEEQLLPVKHWGKEYYTVPLDASAIYDRYPTLTRILASENSTNIKINGRNITLNKGKYFDSISVHPLAIHADKPVSVCQLAGGMKIVPQGTPVFGGGIGDGTFLQFHSRDKMLSGRTEFTTSPEPRPARANGHNYLHYIIVIAPVSDTAEMYLDGKNIATEFTAFEFDRSMAYAVIRITKWNYGAWGGIIFTRTAGMNLMHTAMQQALGLAHEKHLSLTLLRALVKNLSCAV